MIFPDDFESRLGFDQVRSRVRQFCLGDPGRKLTDAIQFESSTESITVLLARADETHRILDRGEDLPIESYDDPAPWFDTAAIEGNFLEGQDFRKIAKAIQLIQHSATYLEKQKDNYPTLHKLATSPATGKKLLASIS